MKNNSKRFCIFEISFIMFILMSISLMTVDIKSIGPEGSTVGFATINQFVFNRIGVNLWWYEITDCLGLVAISIAFIFTLVGFIQLLKRKSLFKVDMDILLLGIFYLIVIGIYIFFEYNIVNYRPILLQESLEASFPSSHTLIVVFIMGTAIIQLQNRIKYHLLKVILICVAASIIFITIIGRLLSGVHWLTDILSSILLAGALIDLYNYINQALTK